MSSGSDRRHADLLIGLAVISFALFIALYFLAVTTEIGQRADTAALTGGDDTPKAAQTAADLLLRIVSIGSLAATVVVLSALAWLRRRPGLLLVPAAVIGTSLVATELFKHVILERPDLLADPRLRENSYPSGHTTVAISIGLAALLIAPPSLRQRVAVGAALLSAAAGVFVVTAEWHRPSDPVGSYLLTLSCAAAVSAWLVRRGAFEPIRQTMARPSSTRLGGHPPGTRDIAARVELYALLAGAGLFVGALVIGSLRYGAEVEWNRFHAAFLVTSTVSVVVAGLSVSALLRMLPPGEGGRPAGHAVE